MRALALLAVAAALTAAGCERRSDAPGPAPGAPSASLVATAGFGAETLLEGRVAARGSVMDATRSLTPVRTAYGGGFVSGMLGRDSDPGGRRDWFFFVDGIEAPVGAADVAVRDGMRIWWDFRDWAGQASVRAVVGSWPAPFAGRAVAADPPLAGALRAAGARVSPGAARWRVRVGGDRALRARDPAWRQAMDDPGAAGLPGAVEDGRVTLLGPGGAPRRPVPGARALAVLVAAPPGGAGGALLAVAGLDEAAARAAAARIARDPSVLARRFAVAFDGAGEVVGAAGVPD